jgi:hypothetical protein
MSKLFINFLVYGVALESVCYLFWQFNVFGGLIQYPLGSAADLNSLNNMFSLTSFNALLGIGGAALIGLAALLLRQGTYALYAMLLWAIGMFFNVVKGIVLAVPNTVAAFLPGASNPTPGGINPIFTVIALILTFAGFMYLFGLVIQRDVM